VQGVSDEDAATLRELERRHLLPGTRIEVVAASDSKARSRSGSRAAGNKIPLGLAAPCSSPWLADGRQGGQGGRHRSSYAGPGRRACAARRAQSSQGGGAVAHRRASRLAGVLPFLGPAFIAAVAYVDPATSPPTWGGSQYGYMLLWVVLAANLWRCSSSR